MCSAKSLKECWDKTESAMSTIGTSSHAFCDQSLHSNPLPPSLIPIPQPIPSIPIPQTVPSPAFKPCPPSPNRSLRCPQIIHSIPTTRLGYKKVGFGYKLIWSMYKPISRKRSRLDFHIAMIGATDLIKLLILSFLRPFWGNTFPPKNKQMKYYYYFICHFPGA